MRIASLLASGTELTCALGAGDELVARSHECDHPTWVARLPCVSRPTFAITGTSAEIDGLVRGKLARGEPLYAVDEAQLTALRPDVLITQSHCEVCAVTPNNVGAPELCRRQVVSLHAGTLVGILEGFSQVATVLGREREGRALIEGIRARLGELEHRLAGRSRPTVACLEWIAPLFHMGNWGPELVGLAGGTNVLGTPGAHSTTLAFEQLRAVDPEVIVVAPCGFGLERTAGEMPVLAALPGWSELRAVREGQVFIADGNLHFNRSSPTVFRSAELLAEMLHPEVSPPVHGEYWRRWSRS